MARIRTIKPEFPQSESIGRLSRDARLLFIQLWTLVDDEGRARANSRMLASLLYPYDDDAFSLIDGWINELIAERCIDVYKIEGSTYVQVCKWLIHQKIDKPSKSKLPQLDESSRILANPREPSPTDLDLDLDLDLDQGGEGIGSNKFPSADADIVIIFDHWRSSMNHPRAVLDQKRKKKIADGLKKYPAEFLKKAIDGCKLSPHHMGDNDSGTVYDDIELILRDTKKIETFAGFVDRPPRPRQQSGYAAQRDAERKSTLDELTGANKRQGGDSERIIDITPK